MENKSCLICGNLGRGGSRECAACHGTEEAAMLGGKVFYFGLPINKIANAIIDIETVLRAGTNTILSLLGILGLGTLGYSLYKVGAEAALTSEFWARPSAGLLFFWLTVLGDLYLWYRQIIFKESKKAVWRRSYEEKGIASLVFASWDAANKIRKKDWIDISASVTDEAIKSLRTAYRLARELENSDVELLHIFAASLATAEASVIFGRLGIKFDILKEKISHALGALERGYSESWFSQDTIKALYTAYSLAYEARLSYVGSGLILYAISRFPGAVSDILYDLEVDERKIKNVIAWMEMNKLIVERYRRGRTIARRRPTHEAGRAMTAVATPFLDQFGEDITLLARYGRIFPIVGREREMEAVFRPMEGGRKSVLILGNHGIGKRSLVEGLAERIVEDDVPKELRDKRLVSLSVSRLISNADIGEAIGRLQHIFGEIYRAGNIILHIPNVHELTSGNGAGADLAEALAAELRKQYFLAICSTTPAEYRMFENTSLSNVLEKIDLSEPTIDESIQILESKVGVFEHKNKVFFSYDAIERAVTLAEKYLPDRFLPEKAIEIVQETAHAVRGKRGINAIVGAEDVAEIISEKGHVPVTKVTEKESETLLHIEEKMRERVIGQSEAIRAVAAAIRRARVGMRSEKRPIANFIFLGPTGVGKTETAKTVAEVYFGSEEQMIRLDMSEYQDKASLYRMIGEPGGAPGGILTEAVRHQPFALLLLDEIEKAHPDILNLFLQVMDDGRLTDNTGRTVDFTNVILIATSNAGTSVIQDEIKNGTTLSEIKNLLLNKELRNSFRPEFLNRFDGIIVFTPLSEDEIRQVAGLMLKAIAKQLEVKGVSLRVSDEAIAELATAGFDPVFGARPLRRVIQERVQDALANFLLQNKIGRRDTVVLEVGGNIRIEKAEAL